MSWLKKQVGDDWYEILSPIVKTPEFRKSFNEVNDYYRKEGGLPQQSEIFKMFELTPLDKLKVILIIDNKDFDAFLKQYDKEFPYHFNTNMMDRNYTRLYEQGIMILPLALTASDKSGYHYQQWQYFGETLCDTINKDIIIEGFDKEFSFIDLEEVIKDKFKHQIQW